MQSDTWTTTLLTARHYSCIVTTIFGKHICSDIFENLTSKFKFNWTLNADINISISLEKFFQRRWKHCCLSDTHPTPIKNPSRFVDSCIIHPHHPSKTYPTKICHLSINYPSPIQLIYNPSNTLSNTYPTPIHMTRSVAYPTHALRCSHSCTYSSCRPSVATECFLFQSVFICCNVV